MVKSVERRPSRDLSTGLALVAVATAAVLAAKGIQKPWRPDCPAYRQKGSPAAKITLVEFSDFQCPHCAVAVEPLKQIMSLYASNVRLLFKHFPWSSHRRAKDAAAAAECAGKQGKFWEMYDLLYAKQDEWSESKDAGKLLASYSEALRLDREAYEDCMKDPSTATLIEKDAREGKDHWINATPTFFINGERFVGVRQLRQDGIRKIERVLGR